MSQRLLPTLLALLGAGACAQTLSWSVAPRGVALATDAAENVYTVDGEAAPAGDITLTKTAPNGVQLFAVKVDQTDPTRHELAQSVETDSTGGAYVAGNSRTGSTANPVPANALLMRFAADGTLRWRVLLGSDLDGGSAFKVLRDLADNAYVLGVGPSAAGQRMRIHRVTPAGAVSLLWQDPFGLGAPTGFKWGRDGSLAVAARASTGLVGGAARVTLDGQTQAVSTQVPALSAVDAAVDAQGHLYIASIDPGLNQGRLARLSASFGGSWVRNDPLGMSRVEVAPDGGVLVGGTPTVQTPGAAVARYAADGSLQWANRDADGPLYNLLALAPMRLDAGGNAYLAGSLLGQMGVSRVNADGSSGWALSVPYGSAAALALGARSNAVYLVGGQTARIDQGGSPPPVPQPDLVLTLSQRPAQPRVRSDITLSTTVRNLGTGPASAVSLVQGQSGTVSLVSVAASQGSCALAQPTRCQLGTLAPGASVTVTQVLSRRTAGSFVTTSTAATTSTEPVTSNNSSSHTTTVLAR